MKHAPHPGQQVYHKGYGMGMVLREWGMWLACPECFGELAQKTNGIHLTGCRRPFESGLIQCPHCRKSIPWGRTVSGAGIFDVRFESEVWPIHFDHLLEHKPKLEAAA